MDLAGFERLRLVGDEDCGVGLVCDDHPDGGRPLIYLVGITDHYRDDPAVVIVDSLPLLLAGARLHLHDHHAVARS